MKKAAVWFAAGAGTVFLAAIGFLAWGMTQDSDDYRN